MKTKNIKKAAKAKAGITGNTGKPDKTGKTGKTGNTGKKAAKAAKKLTEQQREAKRLRDKRYRERLRSRRSCAGCKAEGKKPCKPEFGKDRSCAEECPCNVDLFGVIGRMAVARMLGIEDGVKFGKTAREVEPGVLVQDIELPNGVKAAVTLVDGDRVDPLSERSPIPAELRRQLLRRRMAKEISDLVDSHLDLS